MHSLIVLLYTTDHKKSFKTFLTLTTKQTCHRRAGIPLCHQCCEGSLKKGGAEISTEKNGVIVSIAAFGGQSGGIVIILNLR